jgi:PAS domain S-box-containing protein
MLKMAKRKQRKRKSIKPRPFPPRKRADEKLRESEERYRSLFDRMLDGVYLSTHGGRFVDVNPAFVKIFGYSSKQEMLNIMDIKKELYFSPEERGSHILDTGQEEVEVYRMRRKDGSEVRVEDHGGYVHDEQGNIIYHEGILRDITERTHMEKVLQESEEKYRAIVENSPNMIGIFQDGVLKYINSVAIVKLGWTYEELVSPSFEPIENVVSQKSRSLLKENVGKNLRGEDVAPYEISLTKKDGSEVLVLATGAKIIYNQKPAIEFVFDDITELREMHDELERYSKHLQDSEGKLRALHQHALQLGSANNIEEIVKSTLDAIEFALGFDVADIYLAAGDSLRVRGTRGAPVGLSEEHLNGRGLVAKAARNQATVRVSDTTKEPDYADRKGWDWTGPHTMLSELAVPVVVDAETVAVLNAESIRLDAFSVEDRNLLEILASHAGSAYKRLNYEGKLIALHKHAQQLASATSLDGIVKYTLDAIESPLGVDLADFYVVDTEKECLRLVGLRGWSPSFSELSLRGPGFTVRAANSQQTVRISDISKEEGYVDSAGRSGKAVSTTRLSELAVPVIVEGQTVAVLNVESSQLNAFNDEDQRLLETLAVHVGSALGRLRQVEELEIMARFPSENPNPILRLDRHGTVLSANEASKALLQDWDSGIGQAAPKPWRDLVIDVLSSGEGRNIDIELGGRSYTVLVKPIVEGDYVNLYGRDITERTHMEKALQESEEKYRAIVENSPNLTGIFQDGVLKYVNSTAILKLGWTYEELVSPSFDSIENVVSQKSRSLLQENVGKRLRGEDVAPYEISLTRKDSSEIPVLVRAAKIIYNQKPAIEFVFDDITERKRIEEALANERTVLRTLIDNLPDNIFVKDTESRFVISNLAHARLLRAKTPDEMVGKTDFDIFPRELAASYYDDEQEVIRSGQPLLNREERTIDPEGKKRWLLTTKVPLRDDHGKVIGVTGINRDITERKRLEEELKQYSLHLEELVAERTRDLSESEKRFRELTDMLPETVFELDANGKLTFLNQAGSEMIGYDEADLKRGLSAFQVIAPEDHDALRKNISSILNGGPSPGYEYVILRKDGSRFPGIAYASRIIKEGKAVGLRGVVVDITERKRLEHHLAEANRLATIGETATMVGHDLRNPLQGIAGALHLLKQESLTAEERNEMLQVIEKSVHYSDAIIRDLSEYSAEIRLKLAEATPNSITRDAIGAIEVPQNVTIQDLSEDQPTLRVDPDRMRRVFINLIENAIDAMPQGGTLTISSRKSNGNVEIALTDTGSGISENVMENLWKPFQTTKAKGLGLGLAICRRIVDAHGGNMSVKSEVGRGTTLTMQLPIRPVEVKQK